MIENLALTLDMPLWAVGAMLVAALFGGRYVIMAGGALALTQLFRTSLAPRRIQRAPFMKSQLIREALWSCLSIMMFAGLAAVAIAWRGQAGPMGLYTDIDEYGWLWLALSVPVALLLHDAYFYWTHRLLHHPRVMHLWHEVHHRSHNPSPLASLAFHPVEALVNAAGVVLILTFLPMHIAAVAALGVFSFAFNVLGHLGYELFPDWLIKSPAGRWLNTATSHNLHHRAYKYQFGLYTLVWDRLCGTLHPQYDAISMTAGASKSSPSKIMSMEAQS